MKKLIVANYDKKWKGDILREMHYLIRGFVDMHDYILVDISHFEKNSKIQDAYKKIGVSINEIDSILVIENHDETLVHHIFSDIYESNKLLCIFADDIHKNEELKKENYYEHFDCIFVTYKDPFLKKYPDIDHKKVHWVPHGFTDDHCLPFNEKPLQKLLVSGKSGGLYPFRRKMINAAGIHKDKIAALSHPNYKQFDYENISNLRIGSNYGAALNKYLCCFTDCSSLDYILAKYFEIPATGSLLLAEDNVYGDLEKLGFIDEINYVKCTRQNVMEKLDWILDPENRATVDNIRKAGQELAHEKHHIFMRTEQMAKIISETKIKFVCTQQQSMNKYYVFGMTRNGNRAICYWLQRMLENSIFINNVSSLDTSDDILQLNLVNKNKTTYYDHVLEKFSLDQPVIFFYENKSMEENVSVIEKFSQGENKTIIVLRNPYNVLSSKLHIFLKKKSRESEISAQLQESIELWKSYYYLSCMFPHSVIIYDEWLNNKEYRRSISEKMSLLNVEENIFNVHGYGKSLFNTSLKVVSPDDLLKRYEIHKDHKLYKQLVLGDNELKIMWNSTLEMHCTSLKNYTFNKMFTIIE